MSKENQGAEEPIVDIQEQLSKTEQFINDNKNLLTGVGVGLALLIGGYFGYNSLYLEPLEEEAKEQIWKAQYYFEQDSFNLAINGDGNYYGFETIIEDYGPTKTANLAHYYLGISYLRTGEYELAINNLEAFSSDDVMLSAVAQGAIGDAMIELGDTENAASQYMKAVSASDNEFTAPIYLMKAALAYEALGDYKSALKAYSTIKNDYPRAQEARMIEKYIAKAESRIAAN